MNTQTIIELVLASLVGLLITSAAGILSWAAIKGVSLLDRLHDKVDTNSERLAAIEGSMKNGLVAELSKISDVRKKVEEIGIKVDQVESRVEDVDTGLAAMVRSFADHTEGEEERILNWCMEHGGKV